MPKISRNSLIYFLFVLFSISYAVKGNGTQYRSECGGSVDQWLGCSMSTIDWVVLPIASGIIASTGLHFMLSALMGLYRAAPQIDKWMVTAAATRALLGYYVVYRVIWANQRWVDHVIDDTASPYWPYDLIAATALIFVFLMSTRFLKLDWHIAKGDSSLETPKSVGKFFLIWLFFFLLFDSIGPCTQIDRGGACGC